MGLRKALVLFGIGLFVFPLAAYLVLGTYFAGYAGAAVLACSLVNFFIVESDGKDAKPARHRGLDVTRVYLCVWWSLAAHSVTPRHPSILLDQNHHCDPSAQYSATVFSA